MITDEPRCCSSRTCIIDPAGTCWCRLQRVGRAAVQPPDETQDPCDAERAVSSCLNPGVVLPLGGHGQFLGDHFKATD